MNRRLVWLALPALALGVTAYLLNRQPDPVARLSIYFATISYHSMDGAHFGTVPVIAASPEQANALVVRDFQQKAPGMIMDTLKVVPFSEQMLEKVIESRKERK